MMEKLYFTDYGMVDWLEPREYYTGDWVYVGQAIGSDGAEYTLVRDDGYDSPTYMEMRYTAI